MIQGPGFTTRDVRAFLREFRRANGTTGRYDLFQLAREIAPDEIAAQDADGDVLNPWLLTLNNILLKELRNEGEFFIYGEHTKTGSEYAVVRFPERMTQQ